MDKDLWARANETLERGRAERSGRNDHRYLLTGLMWCPLCGRRVQAWASHSQTQKYHIYGCSGGHKRSPKQPKTCDAPKFTGIVMDALVIELLIELFQSPEIVASAQKAYAEQQNDRRAAAPKAPVEQLKRDIEMCRKREAIAASKEVEAAMNGSDGSAFEQVRADSASKRHALEAELESFKIESKTVRSNLAIPLSGATLVKDVLRNDAISDVEKNALVRRLVSEIYPVTAPRELQVNAAALRQNRPSAKTMANSAALNLFCEPPMTAPFLFSRASSSGGSRAANRDATLCAPSGKRHYAFEILNPFPAKIGRASTAELAQWREKSTI